ncbi:hypothetical protein [Sessilibacter corallicola]|uniref:Lipoprotein n=1 Tax=Sessilibacter corallicola TaxID=2904075 RepID=A0ABQ0A6J6_9GAMM|nr:hypothetical protein [Sessilibacter corallicola]MCE2028608.1 hypothetical protein [Sessilibacter corallicola]
MKTRVMNCLVVFASILFAGCTSLTIDEHRTSEDRINIESDQTVVVLGRRHSSEYETEPSLISCVGNVLKRGSDGLNVMSESEFVDALYPWFEPRTAPLHVNDLGRFLDDSTIHGTMEALNVSYIIWIDGQTETTDSSGSIGCSISVGGAGCFGFGTWDKESDYEAVVWDYRNRKTEGQLSADASGTSYMPAIIIPIPIIARVQNSACKGMGAQLKSFFATQE